MPIDEIDFTVSCSATVTDECELQLTKSGDKARNLMTFVSKLIDQRQIETSMYVCTVYEDVGCVCV